MCRVRQALLSRQATPAACRVTGRLDEGSGRKLRVPPEAKRVNGEARLLCPTSTAVRKTKMLARLLPPVLLVLWAASESGRCDVACPSYCVNSFAVFKPGEGNIRWIKGPDASSFVQIVQTVLNSRPSTTTVTIRIRGVDVSVPSNSKPMILEILKRHPDLAQIIIDFLQNRPFLPSKFTPGRGAADPHFFTPSFRPDSPGGSVVIPHPGPNVPHFPSNPSGPYIFPGAIPSFPGKPGFPSEMVTFKPVFPSVPGLPHIPQGPGILPDIPLPGGGFVPPDFMKPIPFPTVSQSVPPDILSYLELLVKNPDYFVPIYNILIKRGVQFPDITRPFNYNPGQMTTITMILRRLGAVVTTNPSGQITGFILFGRRYPLTNPVTTQVVVNGRRFTLPQDLTSLISFVQSNPQAFHQVLPILITIGARLQKSPTGEITAIVIGGRTFPVRSVAPVRVVIHGRTYTIPADLDVILKQPGNIGVGELIAAFQKLRIPVNVDPGTGNVIGIVMDGVPIPFPVIVRLRVNLGGRVYKIPSDLPAIVTYLQQHGMPANVLAFLYNQFGIIPVRDSNNVVIAISFNNRRYPVPRQPETVITIGGVRFTLPRDAPKLVNMLLVRRIPIEQFLIVIQQAGYKLIPGPDGVLHSVQKGFDVIELPVNIRLIVNINGVRYRVPQDLPRIVQVFQTIRNPSAIEQILISLRKMGVIVQRGAAQITLIFNGQHFSFTFTPGGRPPGGEMPVQPPGTTTIRVSINGRWFSLPDQISDMMTFVRSSGPMAIQLLVRTLRSQGITVNLTPNGADIVSIIIHGQVYPVQGDGRLPSGSGGIIDGRNVQVIIRGRTFMIPRDIGILRRSLPGFQYGELILALHRIGAMLEVDQRGNFYGMRIQGRLIKFAVIFRVNVMLDKSGHKYRVPLDLAELAQGLSSGRNWNWRIVRKCLMSCSVALLGHMAKQHFRDSHLHVRDFTSRWCRHGELWR
ncbi:hypothetical protein HPB52_008426 [Rhipicephalus sanguineus]|uniref:Immunoglobulin G binding protein A n=1 Tax=Rhipicephalus sanguineus TaxID=34632 RepID=A0A9D4T358_RHISA|nr:hypothetical protein HPB52_008426 [Rhipicephalus sanguineus]